MEAWTLRELGTAVLLEASWQIQYVHPCLNRRPRRRDWAQTSPLVARHAAEQTLNDYPRLRELFL